MRGTDCMQVTTGSITSPGLSSWIPERFTVGTAAYTHVDETSRRIRHLARHLGMRHAGKHGIGSTWYGTVSDVLDLAGLTLEFLRYILEETFPHVALEGLSVEEWLEDADWHALVDVRTKARFPSVLQLVPVCGSTRMVTWPFLLHAACACAE